MRLLTTPALTDDASASRKNSPFPCARCLTTSFAFLAATAAAAVPPDGGALAVGAAMRDWSVTKQAAPTAKMLTNRLGRESPFSSSLAVDPKLLGASVNQALPKSTRRTEQVAARWLRGRKFSPPPPPFEEDKQTRGAPVFDSLEQEGERALKETDENWERLERSAAKESLLFDETMPEFLVPSEIYEEPSAHVYGNKDENFSATVSRSTADAIKRKFLANFTNQHKTLQVTAEDAQQPFSPFQSSPKDAIDEEENRDGPQATTTSTAAEEPGPRAPTATTTAVTTTSITATPALSTFELFRGRQNVPNTDDRRRKTRSLFSPDNNYYREELRGLGDDELPVYRQQVVLPPSPPATRKQLELPEKKKLTQVARGVPPFPTTEFFEDEQGAPPVLPTQPAPPREVATGLKQPSVPLLRVKSRSLHHLAGPTTMTLKNRSSALPRLALSGIPQRQQPQQQSQQEAAKGQLSLVRTQTFTVKRPRIVGVKGQTASPNPAAAPTRQPPQQQRRQQQHQQAPSKLKSTGIPRFHARSVAP